MTVHWNRRRYTQEEFTSAWNSSISVSETLRKLGIPVAGGNINSANKAAKELGLTKEHHTRLPPNVIPSRSNPRPLEEILVENSDYSNTSGLKKRLVSSGLLEPKCYAPFCPLPDPSVNPFTGEPTPLKLALDHINGIRTDNRLENLRLLCYHCHGETETWCGKQLKKTMPRSNKPKAKRAQRKDSRCLEESCTEKTRSKFGYCMFHFRKNQQIEVDSKYPPLDILLDMVKEFGYREIGIRLGVSDNSVRKHLKSRGVVSLPKVPRGPRPNRQTQG